MRRRDLLKGLPGAALFPAVLLPGSVHAREMSAEERFAHHLAEFKRAAEELDPMIGAWKLNAPDLPGEPMLLVANRITGRYVGDGVYESGQESVLGRRWTYHVALTPEIIDGERTFRVFDGMDHVRLLEYVLETKIGRRIGGLP